MTKRVILQKVWKGIKSDEKFSGMTWSEQTYIKTKPFKSRYPNFRTKR